MHKKMLEKFDADKDGKLSDDERAKARADREAACDAQVLQNATQQRRSEYGHALLKVEGYHGGLLQHDALAGDKNQGVRGAQIDPDVARELKTAEKHGHPA